MAHRTTAYAFFAALLYALSLPVGKLFLSEVSPSSLAAYMYLGTGVGMAILLAARKHRPPFEPTAHERPYIVAMVVLDIAAPLLLMYGLRSSMAATASALTNMEVVATSLIALLVFKEAISWRAGLAIVIITIASILISLEPGSFVLTPGSLLIVAATVCWGIENNCTRVLSHLDSTVLVMIKGLGAGTGAAIVALLVDGRLDIGWITLAIMATGFATYGLSIDLYIRAQAHLGAAKTSAYYASAPFIGVALSFAFLGERLPGLFWVGLVLLMVATFFLITDTIRTQHTHSHTHVVLIEHAHGDLVHTHEVEITHSHSHTHAFVADGPHDHTDHDHLFTALDVPAHTH